MMQTFDSKRAWLRGADYFPRFVVEGEGKPLAGAGLAPDIELIVVERAGQQVALVMRELSYSHTAQGKLAGIPYLVSF